MISWHEFHDCKGPTPASTIGTASLFVRARLEVEMHKCVLNIYDANKIIQFRVFNIERAQVHNQNQKYISCTNQASKSKFKNHRMDWENEKNIPGHFQAFF